MIDFTVANPSEVKIFLRADRVVDVTMPNPGLEDFKGAIDWLCRTTAKGEGNPSSP
jgi:hypothetical protein